MALNIAANQILATPVSEFLQGRALRMAEGDNEAKMSMLQASEVRAQEKHASEMQEQQIKIDQVEGQRALAKVQQVMSLPKEKRKAYIQQHEPEFVKKFEESRGESWADIDDDEIEEMGNYVIKEISGRIGIGRQAPRSPQGDVMADVQAGYLNPEQADAVMSGKDKDPATIQIYKYAQGQGYKGSILDFQKEMRGGGIRINPDGTIEIGGPGSGVGPGELSRPVINNLQQSIVDSTNRLDRLNQTLAKYKPEFLQARGLAKATTTKFKDFVGLDVSAEDKKYLDEYSQFKSAAVSDLSTFLREMSGTAMTKQEYERLAKTAPSGEELSPTEFEAKMKTTVKGATRAIMRANWALKNGIGVDSVEELSKQMPLGAIDQVYEERANEIWQSLGGTEDTKAKAIDLANKEFGLAR